MTEASARRLGVIDIGTNSIRLLGVEARAAEPPRILLDTGEVTRLGVALASTGAIAPEDLGRSEAALLRCVAAARAAGIDAIDLAGTEVFRAAANGQEVVARLARAVGLPVRILSEVEEAAAAYLGATAWPTFSEGASEETLVLDVGGGSSEVVLGRGRRVLRSMSLPVGALRITEAFLASDPPAAREVAAARQEIRERLSRLEPADYPNPPSGPGEAVGVGGTACALGAWARGVVPYDPARVEGTVLSRTAVAAALAEWSALTLAGRVSRWGLDEGRARLVVGGGLIVEACLARLGRATLRVSTHGLRHGLILQALSE